MYKNIKYKKLNNNNNKSLIDKVSVIAIFVVNLATTITFYPLKIFVS
jgi:hypothetical protein